VVGETELRIRISGRRSVFQELNLALAAIEEGASVPRLGRDDSGKLQAR